MREELEAAAKEAQASLAAQVHAKAVELASERLHSRRQMYVDALTLDESDGVAVLSLDATAGWIDDGMEPHSMLDALLSSPKAKLAADGSRYLVVPFEHGPGKGATNTPASQLDIVSAVKSEMKARQIPWSKIEKDDQGRPKLGRLHKFDIDHKPVKTGVGAGQGWGPVGDVKQGPNERQAVGGGPGGGGIPFLKGVAVYQHAVEGNKTQRSVMTFRIASSKHDDVRWKHPGLEPTNIFEDTYKWALETVENDIVPALIKRLQERL